MVYLENIGRYFMMLGEVFSRTTKWPMLKKLILKDIDDLIYGSLGIIIFISFFIGGVVSIQTALNINNPLIPKYLVGFTTRQSVILEFAPTFTSIIMAGKVGSYITSSIGTMRVTEQIDALEDMGVNALNYLVLPKIIATLLFPFAVAVSIFVGITGGWMAAVFGQYATCGDFITGLQLHFNAFHITDALIKSVVFAFIIATVPSFHGFFMNGGALYVGKSSTTSFVWTSVVIIIANYILTQVMLG